MKAKPLSLVIAALLAAGGLWLARSAWRAHPFHNSSLGVGFKTPLGSNSDPNSAASLPGASQTTAGPNNSSKPGQMHHSPARLAPPDPYRHFTDFTPEQRVQFARQGHGAGG